MYDNSTADYVRVCNMCCTPYSSMIHCNDATCSPEVSAGWIFCPAGDKNSNPGHGFLEKVGRLAAIFNPRTGKAPEEKDAGTSADTTADIRADIEASKDASSDDGISADIRADIAAGRDAGISADINASTNSGKDAGVFANIHATVTAAKSAIKSAGKDAGKSGLIDLFEYTVPRSLNFSVAGSPEVGNRFKTWFTDQEFGRMFLAGRLCGSGQRDVELDSSSSSSSCSAHGLHVSRPCSAVAPQPLAMHQFDKAHTHTLPRCKPAALIVMTYDIERMHPLS